MENRKLVIGRLGLKATLAATVLVLLAQVTLARPPGKPPKAADMPVTTTISDADSGGNPYTLQSDGEGTYFHGVDNVVSILTVNGYNGIPNGDWQFNKPVVVRHQRVNGRNIGINLDAGAAIQDGDPHYTAPADPPFWGTQVLYGHSQVKCTLLGLSMLTMAANTSMTCPMLISFYTAGDVQYGLHPAKSWTGFQETTDAQVTCNSVNSGGCNAWSIDPIGVDPAVGRLTTGEENLGDFYLTFHVHVTRP